MCPCEAGGGWSGGSSQGASLIHHLLQLASISCSSEVVWVDHDRDKLFSDGISALLEGGGRVLGSLW